MDELIINQNMAFLPGIKAGVIFGGDAPAAQPTTGTVLTPLTTNINNVAYWGQDNNFPGLIRDLLDKDAEMLALIDWAVRAAMGKGIVCKNRVDYGDDGEPIYKVIKEDAIVNWYNTPQIRKYLLEGFIDLFTFFNVFPEMITTRDRSKIYSVGINEAMHCRWAQMGPDGKLKQIIHNKNWSNYGMVNLTDPNQTARIPAIDPYDFDIVDKVRADKSLTKFIYPCSYPTIGRTYYQLAHWDGLRVSGWLEIASKIPEFKAALLKNQMTIKYLIRIPNTYWPSVYKKWDDMSDAQRSEAKKAKLKEIDKSLTNAENTGKSILNEVGFDPVTKEKLPGWEIEVIDDKSKPGAFLEDSAEASAHKMRALKLDPTLVGTLGTGKKMGGGSGSDKMIAWNIYLAMIGTYRDIMLEPLYFAAQFGGHTEKYTGFNLSFRDTILQTMNINSQRTQEVSN